MRLAAEGCEGWLLRPERAGSCVEGGMMLAQIGSHRRRQKSDGLRRQHEAWHRTVHLITKVVAMVRRRADRRRHAARCIGLLRRMRRSIGARRRSMSPAAAAAARALCRLLGSIVDVLRGGAVVGIPVAAASAHVNQPLAAAGARQRTADNCRHQSQKQQHSKQGMTLRKPRHVGSRLYGLPPACQARSHFKTAGNATFGLT